MAGACSSTVAVLGAGPLAALLARLAAEAGREVLAWPGDAPAAPRSPGGRGGRRSGREGLPPGVRAAPEAAEALRAAGLVLLAVPAGEVPGIAGRLGPLLSPDRIVVHAAKGLEGATGRRQSEVIAAETSARRLGVLGGPCLASEVAAGYAATLVAASRFDEVHEAVRGALGSDRVRVGRSYDVVGVEIAGAAAVGLGAAAGLCAGLRLGAGARAVLLARGLAEATELGAALGAEAETFRGPAGVADLLVTSGDEAGIGFRFGRRVGAGEHLAAVRRDQGARTEALPTIAGFSVLAGRSRLRLPTWTALHEVLVAGADPRATIDRCLRAAD